MNIPKGWKLVPVEPTLEMLDAAGASSVPDGKRWVDEDNRLTWSTLLDAAPTPPAQDDEALELLRILLIERDGHYSTRQTWDRVRALLTKRGAA